MFSLYDLKKAILCASGGKLTEAYFSFWDSYLWELVEAIEILQEIHKENS